MHSDRPALPVTGRLDALRIELALVHQVRAHELGDGRLAGNPGVEVAAAGQIRGAYGREESFARGRAASVDPSQFEIGGAFQVQLMPRRFDLGEDTRADAARQFLEPPGDRRYRRLVADQDLHSKVFG